MLCISEDDYSDSDHVHTGKYAAPRPHIQADLHKLGREIQRILMEEPGYSLNLCKLRDKYEFFYGKPLDKLGYSKLVDCVYGLTEPITTRNVRPNGVVLLLMRPMRDSCKAFQRGQCPKGPLECECEHECDLCGYPTHGASQCVDEGAPDTKPVQSYTHCCLRSRCVGDIHNPDIFVPDADDLILADLSVNSNRISVEDMLAVQKQFHAPPAFSNPELECLNGVASVWPARTTYRKLPVRSGPALDEKQLKIRAFYAHFIAWLKNRHSEFGNWPREREDFSFEWESYLSGNREMRQTVVALIDFSPSAALVFLSIEAHVVAIVNMTELVWNREATAQFLEITGAGPPPSRRWSQSSNDWGGESSSGRSRNSVPRQWSDEVAAPQDPALQPVGEQKVVFKIPKTNDIQNPPVSSMVWRPESPQRYTSKIPIPISSHCVQNEDEDEEDKPSSVWSSSWRPKLSEYRHANDGWGNAGNYLSNERSNYSTSGYSPAKTDDCDEEGGAVNKEEGGTFNSEEEGAINEEEEVAINEEEEGDVNEEVERASKEEQGASKEDQIDREEGEITDQEGEFFSEGTTNDGDDVVDGIQHQFFDHAVESNRLISHNSVSHMDNIANAYASDSMSDSDSPLDVQTEPADWGAGTVQFSPECIEHQNQVIASNSSFSVLFGDTQPENQASFEQAFAASFEPEATSPRNIEHVPASPVPELTESKPFYDVLADDCTQLPEPFVDSDPFSSTKTVLSVATSDFVHSQSNANLDDLSHKLSPLVPEFIPTYASTSPQGVFVPANVASESIVESVDSVDMSSNGAQDNIPPKITIDNKIVIGEGIGQNYRRMSDVVSRTSDLAFHPDVSTSEVAADLQRLGLVSGAAPNMDWNHDRVREIEWLSNSRLPSFEPTSHQVVLDQNEEFLKNLLYHAILGTAATSNDEMDLFIHECLRLKQAGVESVLSGMRSLWVASRNCAPSASSLFQMPSRPVIANEAHSLQSGSVFGGIWLWFSDTSSGDLPSNNIARPPPSNMRTFLLQARLDSWQPVFEDQEIEFELLPELMDVDLIELGMTNACDRKRFHDTVQIMIH